MINIDFNSPFKIWTLNLKIKIVSTKKQKLKSLIFFHILLCNFPQWYFVLTDYFFSPNIQYRWFQPPDLKYCFVAFYNDIGKYFSTWGVFEWSKQIKINRSTFWTVSTMRQDLPTQDFKLISGQLGRKRAAVVVL